MNTVAFIPLRGGSKSIPLKNIKNFCGRPLAYWAIKAASDCEAIDKIYVATDHSEITRVVENFLLPKVEVVHRSEETATDEATTESALLEFCNHVDFNWLVLIQVTSPLLESKHLQSGIDQYFEDELDSLVSVVRQKRFLWEQHKKGGRPLNYDPAKRPRRQDWDGFFVENGAFYITSKEKLAETLCRVSGKIGLYEMPEETYFEIDEPSDWIIAEQLKRKTVSADKFLAWKNINLLICDVDGVMTDGGMYYTESGDEIKKFNTKDGMGIERLKQAGIKVMILTGEDNILVKHRAEKLNIDYLYKGIDDKKKFLEAFLEKNKAFHFSKTAYIGDDLNDLEAMSASAFSAVPNDGHDQLKSQADYVCSLNGGNGCVREWCDFILLKLSEKGG
ncbi:HAD-IIIA family hydrolase [Salipaludibacillus sp. CF4.18]|uniref:HAD-IIIA family hydrolase n=1 Tax=Salipaludibacillus sp. CF4.18 TaxID=3373081 RepID=UPI003EE54D6E